MRSAEILSHSCQKDWCKGTFWTIVVIPFVGYLIWMVDWQSLHGHMSHSFFFFSCQHCYFQIRYVPIVCAMCSFAMLSWPFGILLFCFLPCQYFAGVGAIERTNSCVFKRSFCENCTTVFSSISRMMLKPLSSLKFQQPGTQFGLLVSGVTKKLLAMSRFVVRRPCNFSRVAWKWKSMNCWGETLVIPGVSALVFRSISTLGLSKMLIHPVALL